MGKEIYDVLEVYGDVTFNATGAGDVIPYEDYGSAIAMGVQALVGVVWWFICLFVYTPENQSYKGLVYVPVGWFWTNLRNPTRGWMAASYLSVFIANILVSFMELFAWFLFMKGVPELHYVWTPFGYFGSIILYAFSPLFALTHMSQPTKQGGLNGVTYAEDYANDMFLMIPGMVYWAYSSITHIWYG